MQLERLLQGQGFGSRRACRALIRAGRVCIAGQYCNDPQQEVTPQGLHFAVDGQTWMWRQFATLVLNKPAGYECSRQPQHHPSVLSLLPPPLRARGVQPVGRLDEDSTGLLILSDDGQLNHRLISGKRCHPKVYAVTTCHPVDEVQRAALCQGVLLHDDPQPVAALSAEPGEAGGLLLTLGEGRYHQVKRMLAAVGNRVLALHRVSIGTFRLPDDLPPGAWRWLEKEEIAALESAV